MKQKSLKTLEELEKEIKDLRSLIREKQPSYRRTRNNALFRGHATAEWPLQTTLERFTSKKFSIKDYNNILWSIDPAISSFTGKDWHVEQDVDQNGCFIDTPPNYEFMAYARHHGFPSPLLDWSQSLYIALFFAYQNANPEERIAIFVYIDSLSGSKVDGIDESQIYELGSHVKTHQRHFAQQAQYTVSRKREGDIWHYYPHEETFNECNSENQDLLYKFTLPGNLKDDVLSRLHEMNINAFTLYSSEESLMEALAYKEIRRNL